MDSYTEGFWIAFCSMTFAFLGLTIRFCLKSKCHRVDCFGLHIHRRVELENIDDESKSEKV
jgi:hypothetical protein